MKKTPRGTVEYFTPMANTRPRGGTAIISWRECSKKHALSLSERSVQQGRSPFDARSVHGVREHGKMARTPLACRPKLKRRLAAFFNIPHVGIAVYLLNKD